MVHMQVLLKVVWHKFSSRGSVDNHGFAPLKDRDGGNILDIHQALGNRLLNTLVLVLFLMASTC